MTQMTDEQLHESYVAKMGEELGQTFSALERELTWMYWRWMQHRALFGEKRKRIDLLNETASFFFYIVNEVFFENAILGIARLTAGKNSGGRAALTVQRLPDLVDPQLRVELQPLVDEAVSAAKFALDWRNNHIAHRSLKRVLGDEKVTPLPAATRDNVEKAFGALRAVLNCVERFYCKGVTAYEYPPLEGARALLYVLSDGIVRREERAAAWRRNEKYPAPDSDI
jgi:AbiU2